MHRFEHRFPDSRLTLKRAYFLAKIQYQGIMAIVAYTRVSTQFQTREGQQFEIENWCKSKGLSVDRWVNESVSGTVAWEKRRLGRAVRRMRKGDCLVCTELSRLGRSLLMIMSILNVCATKGIHIHSIKDNFDLSDSINSKIIAFAFGLAAEIERSLISQRTKEALAAKKSAGVKLGRPCRPTKKVEVLLNDMPEIRAAIGSGEKLVEVARRYNVHRNTLAKYLRSSASSGAAAE